ncbi:max-like protein X [Gigantopelta aegis]|uniref:max-like protein X n=1 Tax=Gigantopelta aegis TaxID=1735272 RepID=UPI001B88DC4F|nr:max-like protein X [Gigantopelta aegis]XP_041372240.1 max-like protein X [Gigantopelta aegis]
MAESTFSDSFEGSSLMDGSGDLKLENSPSGNQSFTFTRTSSCASSASSAHNTDDEDSDSSKPLTYKDRRREAHTVAEQKRRDAIKKGYDELQNIVPTCQQTDTVTGQKMSKAMVLQKSIDYIQWLIEQKKKQEDDLDSLRKEVMALKIMKANYEHIVKTHQNTPIHGQNQVSDEVKFQVFQQVMDQLFQSFNQSISVANFAELSACIFTWLEEYCKPQSLREVVLSILRQLNTQLNP